MCERAQCVCKKKEKQQQNSNKTSYYICIGSSVFIVFVYGLSLQKPSMQNTELLYLA